MSVIVKRDFYEEDIEKKIDEMIIPKIINISNMMLYNPITLFERIGKRQNYIYNWIYYNLENRQYEKNRDIKIYNNITKIHPYKIENIRISYSGNVKNMILNIDENKPKELQRSLFYKKKTNDRIIAGMLGIKQNDLPKKSKYYSKNNNDYIFFRECYWHLTYHSEKEKFKKRVRLHFSFHDFNTLDYSSIENNNPLQLTFTFYDGLDDFENIEDLDKINIFEIFKKICKHNIDTKMKVNINDKLFIFQLVINIDTNNIFLKIIDTTNPLHSIKLYPYLTTNYPGNILTYQNSSKYNLYCATVNSDYHKYYEYPIVYLYKPENYTYIENLKNLLSLSESLNMNKEITSYNLICCKLIKNQFILQDIIF